MVGIYSVLFRFASEFASYLTSTCLEITPSTDVAVIANADEIKVRGRANADQLFSQALHTQIFGHRSAFLLVRPSVGYSAR